ncbi:MAG: hypothetical protein M3Y27_18380, partial [Acidobacteriota bacterium]|nr:hypothetical protein [Acidobacteriota bacterium]
MLRVLFAAFCEDHPAELLPKGSLEKVHEMGKDSARQNPYGFWNEFRIFFTQLNSGAALRNGLTYNAFNSGLFAPDPYLDSINLPNALFSETLQYRERQRQSHEIIGIFGFQIYDFSAELGVESLGAADLRKEPTNVTSSPYLV